MAKVLIIDDSRLARAMIRSVLSGLGHEVVGEAEDFEQGMDAFKTLAPEAVTVDMVLPGGSGMDLLKTLRKSNPAVRIVLITASGQDGVDKQATELGANAIMHKPFTPQEFKTAFEKTLA